MRLLLVFGLSAILSMGYGQTTSWRGTTSTAWGNAANWTNGVPTATVDAILGDANFTGTFQPSVTAGSNCRALTVGGGSRLINLTVNSTLTAASDVNITTLGTVTHTGGTTTVRGNWSVTGTYTPTVITATVAFGGTAQAVNNPTTFSRLTINTGSTTSLAASITVTNAFSITGIFDPVNASNTVTLAGSTFTVNSLGRIRVYTATFSGNYSVDPTLNARSIVEYASSSINQSVAPFSYGVLAISGGMVKSLVANTTLQSSSSLGGSVTVSAGTLDLGVFTLNRNAVGGGTFTVSNGAQLNIGGTNSFPINYTTTTLGASGTVLYNGDNQTITVKSYGHLAVSGTTGDVVKTFPASAMTIAGNFSSTVGTATSVTSNANAVITTNGSISIGASTTFNGGSFTHVVVGSWVNQGTFNGNTGTMRFNGASAVINGAGVQNFNNLLIAGVGVTCTSASVTLTGNLSTTGSGTFTHNSGGTMIFTGAARTISGTGINLLNVDIQGSLSTAVSFTISGNLTTSGSFNATAGTITFSGTSASIGGAGSTTFFALSFSGTINTTADFSMRSNLNGAGKLTATAGTVTFIGTTTVSGTHDLFNATVNGTRLQLGANSTLGIGGALTVTLGTFNTTTTIPNTLSYNGPGNQNITAAIYNNLILATGGTKTALGAIQPRGDFTINSGVTFDAATFTHTVSGNWTNLGTFTQATSTIAFNGTANASITGSTTFNVLTLNKSTATTTVTLNNNIATTTATMTNGRLLTGSNSIAITGTRTGNAIILGTITRTHTFVANTNYAFEGPSNLINFTSMTGGSVTSVTVTVLSAPVPDFPSLNSVNRSYEISVTNTGTYVATVRLHYEDAELNGAVEANLNLWKFVSGSWISFGKTSSDVTSNWVQRTGQADISGRWTFYDGSGTHVWKGTVNSTWLNAGNWKDGVVPQSIDNILIGTEAFTTQPAISTAVTVKSIAFGSVQPVTLSVGGAAGALTVNGNITGDWLADQTHTVNVGSRSLIVGGDLVLSNGDAARRIQLTLSTGTVTVTGSVIQPGAGSIIFTNNGSLSIGTDYNFSGGVFTPATGTIIYNGAADQVIASGVTYNNLTISKPSGIATVNNPATVNGSFTTSGVSVVTLDALLSVGGDVVVNTGTTLNANAAALNVGGNWNIAGTFNVPTGGVVFNGTGNQSVTQTTFNDITVNKAAGVVTLSNDVVVNGDLAVTSGTLDLANFSANRSTAGGTFSVSDGATLQLGGTSNFPANYDTQTLGVNSTVVYNGSTQDITPTTYGNLVLSNSGTKSFSASTPTEAINLTVNVATVLPASGILRLSGNLNNNGSFTFGTGSVFEFMGSSTQTISGTSVTDFGDVTVSNTASPGVSVESNQNLRGVLTLGANVTIDADGSANTSTLTVMSSADNPTQDAAIGILPTGASVLGNVTVQRFMAIEGPSSARIYRYISSPVQDATVADMQNEIPVTGTFTGTSVCSGCGPSSTMFNYDETVTTGGINGGYVQFPVSSNTETFQPGRGYSMFVRGNILFSALWDLRGTINSGAINLPVTFTSSGSVADDGWNLVGNPYPSTIDWNAITGWTKTNVDGTIYVRDNAGTSAQYATWNGVVGTNGGSQYIAAGQAFWVKAGGASPSLQVNETAKTPHTQTTFFREAAPDNLLRVTLSQGNVRDEAVIHFRLDASNEFDPEADAMKLPNSGFNLSSQLVGQDKLAINSLDFSNCSTSIPLSVDNVPAGDYILSFDNVNSFSSSTTVTLVDNLTHTTTDTRLNPSYSFSVTDEAASFGNGRFVVTISMQAAPMDYSILDSSVCPGSDAQIELGQTSDLVTYQVTINDVEVFLGPGNNGLENITLPAGMLKAGVNSVHVAALPHRTCGVLTEKSKTLSVANAGQPVPAASEKICREGATSLAATGAVVGQQYHWYETADGDVLLNSGSSYQTPVLTKSRTYYVSIAGGPGCNSGRVALQAEVINFDNPVIDFTGDKLSVDFAGTKQWYLNGDLLPNETASSITPKQNGVYKVVIPVQSCLAEATYNITDFAVTGFPENGSENASDLKVYPNPVSGYLYFSEEDAGIESAVIINITGRVVGRLALNKLGGRTTGKYDMEMLPAGMYVLVIEGSDGKVKKRAIIKI